MDNLEKKFYRIREVSEMLDIPASTLRFWEGKFSFIKPRRNDKQTRFYTPSDLEKLRMVKYLVKDRGLKIEAAEAMIKNNPDGVSRKALAVVRLRAVRDRLQEMLDALHSLR